MKRRWIEDNNGAVMIEGVFAIYACILVMVFLLSFGFYLYQKTAFRISANAIAEEAVQTYKYRKISDATKITVSDVVGVGKYRYLRHGSEFLSAKKSKMTTFATKRLSAAGGRLAEKEGSVTVTITPVRDDVGRYHYEVELKQKYSFLFGDLLKVVGLQRKETLEAKVYYVGTDTLYYVNTVKFLAFVTEKTETPILGVIDKTIGLIHSIFDIFT